MVPKSHTRICAYQNVTFFWVCVNIYGCYFLYPSTVTSKVHFRDMIFSFVGQYILARRHLAECLDGYMDDNTRSSAIEFQVCSGSTSILPCGHPPHLATDFREKWPDCNHTCSPPSRSVFTLKSLVTARLVLPWSAVSCLPRSCGSSPAARATERKLKHIGFIHVLRPIFIFALVS